MATGKSVKLFNLEDRKVQAGCAITEVDIFQWKNTLLDNLKREPDFKEHCTETSKWEFEKIKDRGFLDVVAQDGTAAKKADQVNSMLTKIASYAPKSIVREITRRTRSLADVWNIARDWAGIQSSGSKHLDYYKVKKSFMKVDKEETKQEFFYRLRDAMEDTLVLQSDNIKDEGKVITEDEDMTPTVKSLVVLDWLDAVGGPELVEHVHRVYAKELESTTLSSLQTRIWKNMDSLMREIENEVHDGKVYRSKIEDEASCRQVGRGRVPNQGKGGFNQRRGNFDQGRGGFRNKFQNQRNNNYNQTGRGGKSSTPGSFNNTSSVFCKLCKASGSRNFQSHDISECWLLSDHDRNNIVKASAKAQALFMLEEEYQESDNEENEELYEEGDSENYDD